MSETTQDFIVARNLCKRFLGVRALDNVSVSLRRGEIRCLAGENGSGKSTFIKILAGVYQADAGDILIDGKPHKKLRPIDSIRAGIQIIYQDLSLFPNLTVAENIALNTHLQQKRVLMNWKKTHAIAKRALERIQAKIDVKKTIAELPIARQQLVAIARAMNQNARLIVMDEPTTALTHREVDALFVTVKNLQSCGVSILFVSHKLQEIRDISETITILRDGRKTADGNVSDFDRAKLVYHMTGRELKKDRYRYEPTAHYSKSVLKLEGYGRAGAFEDVNLDIRAGEIVGISGMLGSGRTELASSLFGLNPPDSGQMFVDGKPVRITNPQDAVRCGIALVPADRLAEGLFLERTVEQNIVASNLSKWSGRWGWLDLQSIEESVHEWINDLRVKTPSIQSPVQTLSGGNQQKVVLAKWLAANVRLMILNGPTVGVDVGAKEEIHNKIKELAQQGMAFLIVSDDLPELMQTCNRILLVHKGRIVDDLDASDCSEDAIAERLDRLN